MKIVFQASLVLLDMLVFRGVTAGFVCGTFVIFDPCMTIWYEIFQEMDKGSFFFSEMKWLESS